MCKKILLYLEDMLAFIFMGFIGLLLYLTFIYLFTPIAL